MNAEPMTGRSFDALAGQFDRTLEQLASASRLAKINYRGRVLDSARRLMLRSGGLEHLRQCAGKADAAGLFTGSDWDRPDCLMPALVGHTLRMAAAPTQVLECMSLLRFSAVARGQYEREGLNRTSAAAFLTKVLALNLNRILSVSDEASRAAAGPLDAAINSLFGMLLDAVDPEEIQAMLVAEAERVLAQRPIQVDHIKGMIAQIATAGVDPAMGSTGMQPRAQALVASLFHPTPLSADDPGLPTYRQRVGTLGPDERILEAQALATSMHRTGLVSDYHADFVRQAMDDEDDLVAGAALGLTSTGFDALRCYRALVAALVREAVWPATAQTVLGLALSLERGIFYAPPVAPSLWRMLTIELSALTTTQLTTRFGAAVTPRARIVAGLLQLLGQPLGVGQGNNPTCQSARALSLWALNDPDYLLHILAQVATGDSLTMHFEGQRLESHRLADGLAPTPAPDMDPISTLLVPHLDRLYAEMGRRCEGRGEDPHRWINPELHGWWVGRNFHIAVDIETGLLPDHEDFVRRFCTAYHPTWNGNQVVIHPQPIGIAATTSLGAFVGWHAISLIRVALDAEGTMRAYFYNPNNDSGQDWGNGTVVSTQGHGERYGEASLPFEQFAAHVYIFHDDTLPCASASAVSDDLVRDIVQRTALSWGATRQPPRP